MTDAIKIPEEKRRVLRRWAGWVSLLSGIAVVLGIVELQPALRQQSVTLPDGSQLKYLGAVFGDAPLNTEEPWQHTARKYLPAAWLKWIPAPITVNSYGNASTQLRVVVQLTPAAGAPATPSMRGFAPGPFTGLIVEDSHGFQCPCGLSYSSSRDVSGVEIMQLRLAVYPRREAAFLVHFTDSTGNILATFLVNNPAGGPYPEWRAAPLPQTSSNQSLSLTLESLREGSGTLREFLVPTWRLDAAGPGWSSASITQVTLEDATGNTGQILAFSEPAWKLHALAKRTHVEDFSAAEKFVITNLELPEAGKSTTVERSAIRAGVALDVVSVRNDGPRNGDGDQIYLTFQYGNTQSNDEVLIRVTDANGNEVGLTTIRELGRQQFPGPSRINVKPRAGVKTIDLTICVEHPLRFEFMVNPTDVKLANP